MPELLIVCAGLPFPARAGLNITGQYLKAYDPEAHDGQGAAEWTTDPRQAMAFPGIKEAFACWTQVPRSRPVRPDGRPNKPLTAFSITFAALDEVT